MARPPALGSSPLRNRGLGALIPTSQTPVVEHIEPTSVNQVSENSELARPTDIIFGPKKSETNQAKVNPWDAAASGGRIGLHGNESTRNPAETSANKPSLHVVTTPGDTGYQSNETPTTFQKPAPIPTAQTGPELSPVQGARFGEIPIAKIKPNSRQPRTYFAETELTELIDSVSQIGVLQPIVVRESGDGYELIMGERRWRAATAAGLTEIPAIIRDTEDTAMLRDALLENLHRANLNPLEEATAYRQLLDDFECSQEELATRIARSRPQITNTLRLLKLPPLVQRRLAMGAISAGHGRALLGLATPEQMEQLAQQIISDGLSVRAVEEIVANRQAIEGTTKPTKRAPQINVAHSRDLSLKLSHHFGTNVRVSMREGHGQIAVDFMDLDDLQRVLSLLAPNLESTQSETILEEKQAA